MKQIEFIRINIDNEDVVLPIDMWVEIMKKMKPEKFEEHDEDIFDNVDCYDYDFDDIDI